MKIKQKGSSGSPTADCSAVWYSIADWGDYDIFNGRRDNITHDKHHSEEAALGVCRMLQRDGFGGNRQVFPVKVWASQTLPEPPKAYIEELSEQNAQGVPAAAGGTE